MDNVAGHVIAGQVEEGIGGDGLPYAVGVGDAIDVEVGDKVVAHDSASQGEDRENTLHVCIVAEMWICLFVCLFNFGGNQFNNRIKLNSSRVVS